MTQNELNNIIIKLKCCSSVKADEMSSSAKIGQCINYKELLILQDYIDALQVYTLMLHTVSITYVCIVNDIHQIDIA